MNHPSREGAARREATQGWARLGGAVKLAHMGKRRSVVQQDLFAGDSSANAVQPDLFVAATVEGEAVPYTETEGFRDRIRSEMAREMARVTAAQGMAWPNPTQAFMAIRRFRECCDYLPKPEGDDLRRRYDAEVDRIDDILEAEAAARVPPIESSSQA
jgi:hypothetical protein